MTPGEKKYLAYIILKKTLVEKEKNKSTLRYNNVCTYYFS